MGNKEFDKVMKGVNDPKEHNPEHKKRLKREADRKVALAKGIVKRDKRRKGHGGNDVIDSGMFGS